MTMSMMRAPLIALTAALLSPAACGQAPGAPAAAPEHPLVQASAADDDQPGRFQRVDALGDGCQDSSTSDISPDGQAFTSAFSAFVAAAGPGTPADQATRGCLLLARVEAPAGWSYALESVDLRGFAGLEDDVRATLRTLYVVPGNPVQPPPPRRFRGELSDNYIESPDAFSGWSACGESGDVWIAVQSEVDNQADADAGGQLTVDSVDGELQWRRCD
jgi:hypothetical protein